MESSTSGEPASMTFGEPAPKHNNLPSMHDLVIKDMEARKRFGLEKYGTPLQPFNGRNALKDAYEEILDLAVYLRQKLYEQEASSDRPNGEGGSPTQAPTGEL